MLYSVIYSLPGEKKRRSYSLKFQADGGLLANLKAVEAIELRHGMGIVHEIAGIRPVKMGGARAGAGRPVTGQKTKVVRLPEDVANDLDKITSCLALVEDWRSRSETASSTSPRWEMFRKFLQEYDRL